jgi:hypothetical protein
MAKARVALFAVLLLSCRAAPVRQTLVPEVVHELAPVVADPGTDVAWRGPLLAGEGAGPAIFRHRSGGRGFAWIAAGVSLTPRGAVYEGRVRVYLDGPVRVRGWMELRRLEAIVLSRGRVAGTPIYLVPGDQVRLVEAHGSIAIIAAAARTGHPGLARSPVFTGELGLDRLGADLEGGGTGPTPGRNQLLRRATELRTRANGEVVWQLPAVEPPLEATVLREEGEWLGVRIGIGPYIVGYVPRNAFDPQTAAHKSDDLVEPEVIDPWAPPGTRRAHGASAVADPWADEPQQEESSGLPPLLGAALHRSLWRLRAGARVRVDGTTMAIFRVQGYAVEVDRIESQVEVLAAVDDTVAVRGTVDVGDLIGPPVDPATIPAPAPETEEP